MLRYIILSITVVFCPVVSSSSAQEWARKMFAETKHDFGSIVRDARAEYRFVLKNIYADDVHIASVRSSCKCATPRIEKALLKTYEEGAIVAKINSDRLRGHQASTITVTIDKPYRAQVQLHVKVYIHGSVMITPEAVRIGRVDQESPAEGMATVTYTRGEHWKILEVRSANPHLSAEAIEISRGAGQVRYELQVHLDDSAPPGSIQDQLLLVTNDGQRSQVPVSVLGEVVPPISVSPASLFLGVLHPGEEVTKQLVVRGKEPFRITKVERGCDCFEFRRPKEGEPKRIHVVPLAFKAKQTPGRLEKKIRIETDYQGQTVVVTVLAVIATKESDEKGQRVSP